MNAPARLLFCALLAGCSGGGSGDAPELTIQPNPAVLVSGMPKSFTISGGTPPYIVSSSDQATVPFDGSTNGQFVLLANPVPADTAVLLSVRGSGTTSATATLTVKPNVVNEDIAIATQECAPAVCAGSDTVATARPREGSIPLPVRSIQFSVASGSFSITSADAVTDASGVATAHLRVASDASGTGTLRVDDPLSGNAAWVTFPIAKAAATGPSLFASPDSLAFSGISAPNCASGQSAQVAVIGGTPPYQVLPLQGFGVSPATLGASGQQFTVTAQGICTGGSVTVLDAAGSSVSVAVSNVQGPTLPPTVPALTVQPTTVELASCDATATIAFAGGSGAYTVFSSSSAVVVASGANTATISLNPEAAYPATVPVFVQSGSSSRSVTVKIDPPSCP